MNHIYVNGVKHVHFAGRLWTPLQIEIAGSLAFIILAPALFLAVLRLVSSPPSGALGIEDSDVSNQRS